MTYPLTQARVLFTVFTGPMVMVCQYCHGEPFTLLFTITNAETHMLCIVKEYLEISKREAAILPVYRVGVEHKN